jgi:hypothetical protein
MKNTQKTRTILITNKTTMKGQSRKMEILLTMSQMREKKTLKKKTLKKKNSKKKESTTITKKMLKAMNLT